MRPDRTDRPIDQATDHSVRGARRAMDERAVGTVDRSDRAIDDPVSARPGDTEPEGRITEGPAPVRIDAVEPDAGVWERIKGRFVDDPDGAIAAAEALVHRTVERKVRQLEEEAATLCGRDSGDEAPSTEARRTRLLRYQAYYERLTGLSLH